MRILNIGSGLLIGCLASLGAGCAAQAQATGYMEADAPVAYAEPPMLVTVEPDIWVVQDSEVAVYYVDDYYWAYRGGAWYRSRFYDGGWVTVEAIVVPRRIVNLDHRVYVHYRGVANAATRIAPRARAANEKQEERRERAEERTEHAQERQDAERERQARDQAHGGGPAQSPAEARENAEHRDLGHPAQDKKPDKKREEKRRGRR